MAKYEEGNRIVTIVDGKEHNQDDPLPESLKLKPWDVKAGDVNLDYDDNLSEDAALLFAKVVSGKVTKCPQLKLCEQCAGPEDGVKRCGRRNAFLTCTHLPDCKACLINESHCRQFRAQGGAVVANSTSVGTPVKRPEVVLMPNELEDPLCMVAGAYSATEFNNRYVHEFHVWVQDALEGTTREGTTQELMVWLSKYKAGVESQLSGARRKANDTGARRYKAKIAIIAAAHHIIHAVSSWSKGQPYTEWLQRSTESMERARDLFG